MLAPASHATNLARKGKLFLGCYGVSIGQFESASCRGLSGAAYSAATTQRPVADCAYSTRKSSYCTGINGRIIWVVRSTFTLARSATSFITYFVGEKVESFS